MGPCDGVPSLHMTALTAILMNLALWRCGQSAGLAPCRPGLKSGWGDYSLPSATNGVRSGMACREVIRGVPVKPYEGPPSRDPIDG